MIALIDERGSSGPCAFLWKDAPDLSLPSMVDRLAIVANPFRLGKRSSEISSSSTSMVGRVGFEPTITGARDRYHLCPDGILDQAVPTEARSGPPPLCWEQFGLQINHSTTLKRD